jgi:putative phosphoesterase
MRVLIVSDIHSNLTSLERVIEDAGDFDCLICAGDIVGYGPEPGGCVDILRKHGAMSVKGNHDVSITNGDHLISHFNVHAAMALEINRRLLNQVQLRWVRNLSTVLNIDLEGYRISIFHGSPKRPIWEYIFPSEALLRANEFFKATEADVIFFGHTHVPFLHRLQDRALVNPGSVGQPRDGNPKASYMLMDISGGIINFYHRRVEYDIDKTTMLMREIGLSTSLSRRLYLGI